MANYKIKQSFELKKSSTYLTFRVQSIVKRFIFDKIGFRQGKRRIKGNILHRPDNNQTFVWNYFRPFVA